MRKSTLSASRVVAAPPTLDEIKTWPAVVNVERASRALGFSKSHGFNLIRDGRFPARVIEAGGRKVVVTASIIAALSADVGAA